MAHVTIKIAIDSHKCIKNQVEDLSVLGTSVAVVGTSRRRSGKCFFQAVLWEQAKESVKLGFDLERVFGEAVNGWTPIYVWEGDQLASRKTKSRSPFFSTWDLYTGHLACIRLALCACACSFLVYCLTHFCSISKNLSMRLLNEMYSLIKRTKSFERKQNGRCDQ